VAYSLAKVNNPEGLVFILKCTELEAQRDNATLLSAQGSVMPGSRPYPPPAGWVIYLYSLTVAAVLCGSARNYYR